MGFATIVAILAFFIALVALWLTSDIIKKVENQNEKFVRSHMSTIREELRDMDKMLHKTMRVTKQQIEGQSEFDKRLNDHTNAFESVNARLMELSQKVEELDRSIPQRYRVRTVKEKVKSVAKPSIQ